MFLLAGQHQSDVYKERHARLQAYLQGGPHEKGADIEDCLKLPWLTLQSNGKTTKDSQSVKSPIVPSSTNLTESTIVSQYGLSPRRRAGHKDDFDEHKIESIMWHLAKDVLAEKGVHYDERGCAFFVDKFTGLRVYVHQKQTQSKSESHDHEQNDVMCVPRRAQVQEDSGTERKQNVELHHHLSKVQNFLQKKHISLDQRLRDLATLKSQALEHATAMAAENRRISEAKIEWEMLRLDHEIWTTRERLKKCSKELAAADPSWRHHTACATPIPTRQHRQHLRLKAPINSPFSTMAPSPMLAQASKPTGSPNESQNSRSEVRAFAGQEADLSDSILIINDGTEVVRNGEGTLLNKSQEVHKDDPRRAGRGVAPQVSSSLTGQEATGGKDIGWKRECSISPTSHDPSSSRDHPKTSALKEFEQLNELGKTVGASSSQQLHSARNAREEAAAVEALVLANTGTASPDSSTSNTSPMFKGFAILEKRVSQIQDRRLRLAKPNNPFLRGASPPQRGTHHTSDR